MCARTTRPSIPLLIALLLVTVPLVGCVQSDSSADSVSGDVALQQRLGDPATSGLDDWPGPIEATPTTYDLNGDGVEEVLAHSRDRTVYAFDPSSGQALATLHTSYPPSWHTEAILNSVAADKLAPGEDPSIVVSNPAAYLSRWQVDQSAGDGGQLAVEKVWEHRMDTCNDSPSMDGGPVLADLDGDGELEILVQGEEQGLYAVEPNGTLRWHHCWAGGNSAPTVADLDGDGRLEAIFASDDGLLAVLDGGSGEPMWTFDVNAHGVHPGSMPQTPTVADLDGELPLEVLFIARSAEIDDPDRYDENHMAIFAVGQDPETWKAELKWMRQPDWANPMSITKLVVDDVDDDGEADIFGMDWNTIGHRPGNWEVLGPANVFRLDAQGQDVWVRQVDTWWSNSNIALADFDQDGAREVLVNAPAGEGDGLWRISADSGKAEARLAVSPWKVTRGPQLLDLDADGSGELVVAASLDDPDVQRGAILVYSLWSPP